jgi:hypothetical protein
MRCSRSSQLGMHRPNCTASVSGLVKAYLSHGQSAGTIVRMLKKTATDTRHKLIVELRNLEKKRLELLDQMDDLAKST